MQHVLQRLWGAGPCPEEQSRQLVELASALAALSGASEEFRDVGDRVPRIVVVGTQSSGKSSLLNRMLRLPLLPVGSSMVTRTPVSVEMRCCPAGEAESVWVGLPGGDGREVPKTGVRAAIEEATRRVAGDGKGISDTPVVVRARLRGIPDLNLTDLPGLTLTPLRDQGQPEDIRDRLVELARGFCAQPNTVALGIFPARPDLEADYAFSVLRDIARPETVVGVLTKPDLCEDTAGVAAILSGSGLSADLQLEHGYFAVRTDLPSDAEEAAWAAGQQPLPQARVGVQALVGYCCGLQLRMLRSHLPALLEAAEALRDRVAEELRAINSDVPESESGRAAMAINLVAEVAREVAQRVTSRGSHDSVGRDLKRLFVGYRTSARALEAFAAQDQGYFDDVVERMEGNHMAFDVPGVDVVEAIVQDPQTRPLRTFEPLGEALVDGIESAIEAVTRRAARDVLGSRFPRLLRVIDSAADRFRAQLARGAKDQLRAAVRVQEAYVWTDDASFLQDSIRGAVDSRGAQRAAEHYVRTVAEVLSDVAPKTVMRHLVRQYCDGVRAALSEAVGPDDLNEEHPGTAKRRRELADVKRKCEAALTVLTGAQRA